LKGYLTLKTFCLNLGNDAPRTALAMHDPAAISVTPLDKIDSERYLTDLARKLVCISFDVQTKQKILGEAFIRITGGDPGATRSLYAW
jgi:hypothetical protein